MHAHVVDDIGSRIVRGAPAPGETLPNVEHWCEMLGVSRTALREALKVLSSKGLIEARQRSGTRVRQRHFWDFLDPDVLDWRLATHDLERHARELFELRRMIEPKAAELAAERHEPEQLACLREAFRGMQTAGDDSEQFAKPDLVFHQTILRMTANELIGSLASVIEAALAMSFRLSNDNPAGQRPSLPLHRDVLAAIEARSGKAARKAMIALLEGAERDVEAALVSEKRRRTPPEG